MRLLDQVRCLSYNSNAAFAAARVIFRNMPINMKYFSGSPQPDYALAKYGFEQLQPIAKAEGMRFPAIATEEDARNALIQMCREWNELGEDTAAKANVQSSRDMHTLLTFEGEIVP